MKKLFFVLFATLSIINSIQVKNNDNKELKKPTDGNPIERIEKNILSIL